MQSLPDFIEPELAVLVARAPEADELVQEIKLDGSRSAARIEGGAVRMLTRRGLDWTTRFRTIAKLFRKGFVNLRLVAVRNAGREAAHCLRCRFEQIGPACHIRRAHGST